MNAPPPPDTALFRGESAAELLPVADIEPSPTNSRKRIDKAKLQELTENVAQHGILQPILVRPHPKHPAKFEIVAGERRWKAAKGAQLQKIPAVVRTLTDEQALELQCIENLQREDVHPLEEAEGYELLIKRHGHTVEDLAAKLGKSRSYVYGRLKLCALSPKAREWFYKGVLTPASALIIARIPVPSLQDEALKDMTRHMGMDRGEPLSATHLRDYVQRNYMLQLDGKAFAPGDATLVPAAGACGTCPKRTGNAPDLFGDIKDKDTCTDPTCFAAKKAAQTERVRAEAEAKGQMVVSGKDAKKIFPHEYSRSPVGDFVRLDEPNYHDPKHRTFEKLLGTDAPPVALVQHPYSGDLIPVALEKDVRKALKAKGIATRPSSSGTSEADKERKRKAALVATIRRQIFWHVRNQPATLGLEDLRLIARRFYLELWHEHARVIDATWEWKVAEAEIMKLEADRIPRLLLDLALVGATGAQADKERIAELLATAERHGVDHKAIRKELVDAAREKIKPKKKPAAKGQADDEGKKPKAKRPGGNRRTKAPAPAEDTLDAGGEEGGPEE